MGMIADGSMMTRTVFSIFKQRSMNISLFKTANRQISLSLHRRDILHNGKYGPASGRRCISASWRSKSASNAMLGKSFMKWRIVAIRSRIRPFHHKDKEIRKCVVSIGASVLAIVVALGTAWPQEQKREQTDAEIRQILIAKSLAKYSGSCPCPCSVDRGGRSAYSRPGGVSPLCYESDVTDRMVESYRKRTERSSR